MFAVYKKELKQYFCSMIGFVFLAFFIAIISIYTWANNFYNGIGNFELTLSSSSFLFVLLIPILTMRVIAEERHQKTDQLLYTSPVPVGRIIAGKYLALLTLFGIGILFIGLYPLLLRHYGETVQLAASYSALLGFFLLGAAYIAVGTFISSLTESQPIAAVVSFLVLLLSVLISSIAGALPSDHVSQAVILSVLWLAVAAVSYYMMHNIAVSVLLAVLGEAVIWVVFAVKPAVYEGLVSDILKCAALSARFEDFTLGVLKYDVIVYYIGVQFLFVFLTIQNIRRNTTRQFRSGVYRSLVTVIVIALVVVVNLMFHRLDLSADLTSDSLFTLSKETKKALKNVEDDVTVYYMVAKGEEQDYIQRVLKQYNKVSEHVKVVRKDPVIYPAFSQKYVDDQISQNDVIVVNEKTNAAKYISNGDMYYDDYSYYGSSEQYLDVEGRVTSAIQKVLSTDVQKLYVVTGHGEQEMTQTLSDALEKMNVEVESISLVTEQKVPEDCTLLLLDGPQNDLRESEKNVLLDYLKDGGHAILMPGYVQGKMPQLEEILEYYGIGIQKGVIYEGAGHYENYLNWIVPSINTEAELMSDFGAGDYVVIGSSQGLAMAKESSLRSSLALTELLTTSKQSLLKADPTSEKTEKEKGDTDGPFVVGVYAEEAVAGETTKLAVISTNEVQEVLLENIISRMAGDDQADTGAISIEAKNLSYSSITMNVASQIIWAVVLIILVPLGLLLTGFGIWFVRRRK